MESKENQESQLALQLMKVNVGGKIFQTTKDTLLKGSKFFRDLLSSQQSSANLVKDEEQAALFIDRNPKYFELLLDYLRSGYLPSSKEEDLRSTLQKEATFYGIDLPKPSKQQEEPSSPLEETCVLQVRRSGSGYSIKKTRLVYHDKKDLQQEGDQKQEEEHNNQGRETPPTDVPSSKAEASPTTREGTSSRRKHHQHDHLPIRLQWQHQHEELLGEVTVHERPDAVDTAIDQLLSRGWSVASRWEDPATYQQSVHFVKKRKF